MESTLTSYAARPMSLACHQTPAPWATRRAQIYDYFSYDVVHRLNPKTRCAEGRCITFTPTIRWDRSRSCRIAAPKAQKVTAYDTVYLLTCPAAQHTTDGAGTGHQIHLDWWATSFARAAGQPRLYDTTYTYDSLNRPRTDPCGQCKIAATYSTEYNSSAWSRHH